MYVLPNITIIVLDTLRLDEFNRIEGKMDFFKDNGFSLLDNVIAPSSWTLPSHASLFTGLYPSEHGAHETKRIKGLDIEKIKLKKPIFVSELRKMGYRNYAISANPYVHPVYGFAGFDEFMEEPYFTDVFGNVLEISGKLKPIIAEYRNTYGNDALKIAKAVLREKPDLFLEALTSAALLTPKSIMKKAKAKLIDGWPIEKGGKRIANRLKTLRLKRPFFLFVNLMEAHDPYFGKKGMDFDWSTPFLKKRPSDRLMKLWKKLYAKASLRAYAYAADMVETLQRRFGDGQIIIVTSDHGQLFGEHGFIGHGTVLYDEVVKVPFAVKTPYKIADSGKYKSIKNVSKFLFAAIEREKNAMDLLADGPILSESFGVPANLRMVNGIDLGKLERMEKRIVRKF